MNDRFVRPSSTFRLASLAGLLALTASAMAAPPQIAYLEKAQTQASESQIRSYGVPATDSAGKLFYWDVTVDLAIDATGKPNPSAAVTSIKQVKVNSTRLVAGNYVNPKGGTCKVSTATLPSGRQESSVICNRGTSYFLSFSVVNGKIAGHPFELELNAAGIGDITGYLDYFWGMVASSDTSVQGYGVCFATNHIVSARQVGTQIAITNYGQDNRMECGLSLVQVP